MTVPTIGELKGNTILELFKNGYNALKNAITGKQNKLIAGDNIVITDDNVISAITGGEPVMQNYYTKTETDELLDAKADAEDVYTKDETDDAIQAVANELPDMTLYYLKTETFSKSEVQNLVNSRVKVIEAEVSLGTGSGIKFTEQLKSGDIVVFEPVSSTDAVLPTKVFAINSTNSNYESASISVSGSGSSFVKEEIIYRLFYSGGSDPYYGINGLKYTFTVTSGSVAESHSIISNWTTNSKVYIYRVEE